MSKKFDFDRVIDRRGTSSIKWDTLEEGYLSFLIADLDFKSPPAVIDAIKNRVEHGVFGYTLPDKELFKAIDNWFSSKYGFELKEEWISYLPGIVPSLSVASSLSSGSVLTTVPNYSLLLKAPEKVLKKRIDSPLRLIEGKYEIDFEDLEGRVTQDTEVFLMCNPHNPIGKVYSEKDVDKILEFCEHHGLILVSDEIHCEILYDGKHVPVLTRGEIALDRSITLMSPGKICNLPGIPVAFAIIPNKELKKRFDEAGYGVSSPGILGYEACKAAYGASEDWKEELVEYLRDNRDYLEREIANRFPGVVVTHPEATFLMWIDFRPLGLENPSRFFKEKAKVAVSDGKYFGGEGFVRLNFGCARGLLVEALDRIEAALRVGKYIG